jgi:phosphatidylglycerol:prolipoprotein diacylglycerol transferase
VTESVVTERSASRVAPYWFAIGFYLLLAGGLFLYFQLSGTTPDSVAVHIEALNFDVYWYGIWIVSGIALGCWVVASLAAERAQRVFEQTVPAAIRQQPLTALGFPAELEEKLHKHGVDSCGAFLLAWGFDPRNLGVKRKEIPAVEAALLTHPTIEPAWLHHAPWRIWNPEHVWNGIIWALLFGLIGARLYHVLTPSPSMAALGIESPLDYFRNPYQLINLRAGGLGIFGGIAGGALGLFLYSRRARIPMLPWADLAVVGLALGQSVGRWGNFFNQELYGRPADLPWAITIDRPLPAYTSFSRFHPAFLYESIWSFLSFLLLYFLTRRYAARFLPGELTAFYLILYAGGRSLLELIRLDSRTVTLGGMDTGVAVATLVSLIIAVLAILLVLVRRVRRSTAAA